MILGLIETNAFNPPLWIKLTMSIALSIFSIVLYLIRKNKIRHISMVFMVLSTIGDIFMTDSLHIGDASLYPGAGSFILGHILIGLFYIYYSKKNNYKYLNKGFNIGLILTIVLVIIIEVLAFVVPSTPHVLFSILIAIYMIIIGFNMVGAFSLSYSRGDKYKILPISLVLFLLTDIWIFLNMLDIYLYVQQFVWYFYPIAQLGIILSIENIPIKQLFSK